MKPLGYSRKYPPPPPLWTTLNWVPKNFRISKKDSSSLCRIPNPADSNSSGIPEFCKVLNGFPGIVGEIHGIPVRFTQHLLQEVRIFSGIAHSKLQPKTEHLNLQLDTPTCNMFPATCNGYFSKVVRQVAGKIASCNTSLRYKVCIHKLAPKGPLTRKV